MISQSFAAPSISAPLWKIIRYAKNLAKIKENSLRHFHKPKPRFRVPEFDGKFEKHEIFSFTNFLLHYFLILEHCDISGEIVWNNELISQVFLSGSNTEAAAAPNAAISDAGTSGYAQWARILKKKLGKN